MEAGTQEAFKEQYIIDGNLRNITFGEWLALPDDGKRIYIGISRAAKPKDCFNIGDLFENYFGPVKDAQEILGLDKFDWSNAWELIGALKGIHKDIKDDAMWAKWLEWEKRIGVETFFDVSGTMRWLMSEIERINKIEAANFNFKPDGDMIAAGIDRLSKFAGTGQVNALCKEWGKTPEEIRALKYSMVLRYTLYQKEEGEFTKEYQQIVMDKMKRRNGN